LTDTSINPATRLATDYLSRFNEAVMLLGMLSNCPEVRDDFLAWEPMSYREHFRLSHFKTRDMAIAAYDQADPNVRNTLDTLAVTMTIVLEATRAAMDDVDRRPETVAALVGYIGWLKPLIARAGAIINSESVGENARTPQEVVDRLMKQTRVADERTYPQRPFLAVSAAIFRNGKVLVVRRARKPALNLYTLPGGAVEAGETLIDAVIREVREETSLSIEPIGLAGHREVIVRDDQGKVERHFVILYFAARWLGGEPVLSDELDDSRWLDPPELGNYRTTDGLAETVTVAATLLAAR
jgi:8-oxo-dGTP diphosphatase